MTWTVGRKGFACLLAAAMLLAFGAARAGEQAERALAAARQLLDSGAVPRNASIRVAFKSGNIAALLGPELELQKEWEQRSGVMITAKVIPQQPALQNLKANPDVDLTVARTHEFPDLLEQGLVEDLTPMLKEFGFRIDGTPPQGFIRPRLQGYLGDKVVAIPADGDVLILYLRRDLLESPAERAAFRKAYGRDLAIPATWQEYDQLAEFFHRPQKGLYGTVEQRERDTAWMFWLPRYLGQGAPYRQLFDDRLKPLIDSPAGVAATESYVRTVRHSAPEILGDGKDYSYTTPIFMQGKAFSVIFTIAGAKLFNSSGSAVRGKFMAVPLPGNRVGGKVVRSNVPIYGNNLVVSSRGAQRKLAFLFTMWLTDPDNSLRTVGVRGGFTDPFRWNHLADQRIRDLYTQEALAVFAKEWPAALPPGTGLPGDGDYIAALNQNLWLAASGKVSASEAMRRTSHDWEAITQQHGRDKQASWLKIFNAGFAVSEPGAVSPK
ncbi:MAG: extracellular solute-binding protein [Rhodocyclales bacterium]|nr:extracellular solute-binding protein [Rhodocyclales bacterium]